jgi:hypothetical protein
MIPNLCPWLLDNSVFKRSCRRKSKCLWLIKYDALYTIRQKGLPWHPHILMEISDDRAAWGRLRVGRVQISDRGETYSYRPLSLFELPAAIGGSACPEITFAKSCVISNIFYAGVSIGPSLLMGLSSSAWRLLGSYRLARRPLSPACIGMQFRVGKCVIHELSALS